MAFCQAPQPVIDPLKINTEVIKLHPSCDSSVLPDSVFKGINFPCETVEESIFPPPKQRLVKSINFDMCTETLGCETGGAMCSSYEFEVTAVKKKKPPSLSAMEVRKQRIPPPPLTTLGAECRLSLRRKREEGRLILFAFKPCVLEAERSGGRLLLRFFRQEEERREGR